MITAKERQTKMAKTTHKRTRIEYTKYFLTGTLKGLTVRCGYELPAELAAERCENLQRFTKESPGTDFATGATWAAYNVGTIWLD